MKRIILTGGGTAGHVTPNLALLPSLKEAGFDGSKKNWLNRPASPMTEFLPESCAGILT